MPQYQNTPQGFADLLKRIIMRSVPISFIGISGGFVIAYSIEANQHMSIYFWIFEILFICGIMTYALFKSIARQKQIYISYLLITGSNYLSRQQNGLPAITLPFNTINEITEDKEGNLLVKGPKKEDIIIITAFVENYEEIKDLLQRVKPITIQPEKNLQKKYPLVAALVSVGLMVSVFISNNKIVVGICGAALVLFMLWSFYKIQTSKLVDSKVKNTSWFFLIVIASIITVIYYKVFVNH